MNKASYRSLIIKKSQLDPRGNYDKSWNEQDDQVKRRIKPDHWNEMTPDERKSWKESTNH